MVVPLAATLALAGCSVGGDASPTTAGASEADHSVEAAAVPTIIVLDASESMQTADAPGRRWDAATKAVDTLVHGLPAGTKTGVVVFGAQMPAKRTPPHRACADVKTVLPLGKHDPAGVTAALTGLAPQGFTPIGTALQAAAAMLPDSPASVVLVSDGESTCEPDPCAATAEIRAKNPKVTISAVGLRTDAQSLQCVAGKGGGIFLTADNAAQLSARLRAAQNAPAARTRLNPVKLGNAKIGDSLDEVAGSIQGFPRRGRRDGDHLIIVWQDCSYVFDDKGKLIEIAPGDPPGSAGVTIDGVAAGTPGARAVELYGKPVAESAGSAVFEADKKAGTGYRIGYRGARVESGTVTSVVLCRCLPEATAAKPTPVLGRDKWENSAYGFGTARPDGFSIASTAASSVGEIVWESWGGSEALGRGTSQQNGAGNPKTVLWVRASDLGWCDGVWAYRELERSSSRDRFSGEDKRDICNGDRSEPSKSTPITLSPKSKLTFGGAGGVYVGDNASKIPRTYVSKQAAGMGVFEAGTEFYHFAKPENAYQSDRVIRVGPRGEIQQFEWDETDRGVKIGQTEAQVRSAYKDTPSAQCSLYPPKIYGLFFTEKATGRIALFVINDGKVTHIRAATDIKADVHCPFE
ncbi:vWA domain-containing protein [Gordonia crocea]|uniref:VWFA domain-containing protein n=1 Tax=Gordonia crocea TaxID=589162 RepID=A0A7I9V1C3_9ACTN|nr:VWA domain-containing protein [Gordonia crocea]GED98986.1 hypothetical protein nbrc107697_30250 [Gordonia crocea]GED99358.1 hypothetical protein nbrc107697_33970 [Gordonia crocea]